MALAMAAASAWMLPELRAPVAPLAAAVLLPVEALAPAVPLLEGAPVPDVEMLLVALGEVPEVPRLFPLDDEELEAPPAPELEPPRAWTIALAMAVASASI